MFLYLLFSLCLQLFSLFLLKQSLIHTLPGGILATAYADINEKAIRSQSLFDPLILLSITVITIMKIICL